MTSAVLEPEQEVAVTSASRGALSLAGFASLGAGAIHAAAVGVHNEHRQASLVFVFAAAFQLGWGAWATLRSSRFVGAIGAIGSLAMIGGWLMAKTRGISFVDGLEDKEPVQFADGLAAALAAVAVLVIVARVLDRRANSTVQPAMLSLVGSVIAALTIPGMAAAGTHAHAHEDSVEVASDGHLHAVGTGTASAADHAVAAADQSATPATVADDGHAHAHSTIAAATVPASAPAPSDPPAPVDTAPAPDTTAHAVHEEPAASPKPYDPTKPIDLGGVEGVSPEQQARAENLIAATIRDLPQFSDPATLPALGWHSIGDAFTGYEHFVNWSTINDDRHLDPDEPESLVFVVDRATGKKQLASAMFMLPTSVKLDEVPDIGGPLTQWHIHNNLCYSSDPAKDPANTRVIGLTDGDGKCRVGFQPEHAPMIHVWITPHKCGPFSALEGVGAGQVADGETTLCDHAHGSTHG